MNYYQETTQLQCVDNGTSLTVDVLDFIPLKYLAVSVNKSVKLTLNYNSRTNVYAGNMAGLTFTSQGPRPINTLKGK